MPKRYPIVASRATPRNTDVQAHATTSSRDHNYNSVVAVGENWGAESGASRRHLKEKSVYRNSSQLALENKRR